MNTNNRYYSILSSIYKNIRYFEEMIALSKNMHLRMFYESLLYNEKIRLNYWKNKNNQLSKKKQSNEKIFTIKELSQYDGSNGKPAYVAVNGIVYDVSLEATWGGGTHFNLYAGKDLTSQFAECHGSNEDILKNLPIVGILQK